MEQPPPLTAQEAIAPLPPIEELPPPTPARRYRRCLVSNACCCLTLQQGAMLIGILQVLNGILILVLEVMYLAGVLSVGAYAMNDDLTGTLPGDEQRYSTTDIAYASLSGLILFQELMVLIFAGLLLHGARMERPGYIRAWLIFTAIWMAIGIGSWAGRLTLEFMYKPSRGAALLIRCLIFLALPVYFLLVVRSYYYQLVDELAAIAPYGEEGNPLMRRSAPPPYSPGTDDQAPPLEPKRPLETSFDATTPTTISPPDERFYRSASNGSYDGGVGPGLTQPPGPVPDDDAEPLPTKVTHETESANDSETVPRVISVLPHDGQAQPARDSGRLPGDGRVSDSAQVRALGFEDDDAIEIRPLSRRVIGAGRMVLPPLPPGHRESLQHVVMDYPVPTSTAPTLL